MGDLSFLRLVEDLAFCAVPLIASHAAGPEADAAATILPEAELFLTPAGAEVLAGGDDHVAASGIDRWWGGTRLLGKAVWRYDRRRERLIPPTGKASTEPGID